MKLPVKSVFALLALAFIAFYGAAAFAQTTQTTPNPFGGAQQPDASPPKKARPAPALKAGQFSTEAEAKSHCPGDTVVWANTSSKIYHYSDASDYGKTKRGAYMCEKDTAAAGIRAAKNEKRKS